MFTDSVSHLARTSLITLVVMGALVLNPAVVSAASPSPSPKPKTSPSPSPIETPSSSPSAETTEKLKARIEKIVEEKKSQIMGAINDLQQERRGFIGEVLRISAETITLKTTRGTQILALTDDVAVTQGGKAIEVSKIAVGDWAMVIGHNEDDEFKPDLIEISSASLRPKSHLIGLGSLIDVAKTTVTFKGKNKTEEQKLNIIKTSEYQDKEGNPLTFKQVTEGADVLLIGQQNGTNWEVELIRVLSPLE